MFSEKFICAGFGRYDYREFVPAPLLRRSFYPETLPSSATLTITGLGYYRLFINGKEITISHLAPYTNNLDNFIYYNSYDIEKHLLPGENVIGIILGNGIRNCVGGKSWGFDKASYRGDVCTSLSLEADGKVILEADEEFLCHPSPIIFDDLRAGEIYDARKEDEINRWAFPGFDASSWTKAKFTDPPKGEKRLSTAPPIKVRRTLRPVGIWKEDDAYIFDFGQNGAGLVTLNTSAEEGRRIVIDFGDCLIKGKFFNERLMFTGPDTPLPSPRQTMQYISKGGEQTYTPSFTYYGLRYARVRGIKECEAVPSLLTFIQMNSEMHEIGSFSSSDEILNKLQKMTREADLSNLVHIPTDCPQREKSGWTGDAALSALHMLLNLDCDELFIQWMRDVAKSVNEEGAMPGIVPAAEWGYYEWNGPSWGLCLIELPYRLYELRGNISCAGIAKGAMIKYISYLVKRRDSDGLLHFGLGDWLPPHDPIKAPVELTDTVAGYESARKAAILYSALGMEDEASFCRKTADEFRSAMRLHLLDREKCIAAGNCQTSQAMFLFYNIFDKNEREKAACELKRMVEETNGHIDCGCLGARVIFRALAENGMIDLAYRMLTYTDAPSYGEWVVRGDTTAAEDFYSPDDPVSSRNHHFLGDISAFFIDTIAGIKINPDLKGAFTCKIAPCLPAALEKAEAFHIAPFGRISVSVKKAADIAVMKVQAPYEMCGEIYAPAGYFFKGKEALPLRSGTYIAEKHNDKI